MFEEDTKNLSLDSIRQKPKSPAPQANFSPRPAPRQAPAAEEMVSAHHERADRYEEPRIFTPPVRKKIGRPFFLRKRFWITAVGLAILVGAAYLGLKVLVWGQKIFNEKNPLSFLSSFGQLFTAGDRRVTGEDSGRVNILLLGIGGEGHEGALLTDTVILASIKTDDEKNPQISLLSIPRDMVVKLPDGLDYRKINSAYAYGEVKREGLGAEWVMDAVEKMTGQDIPFYALVDFTGFKKTVDDLGGIEVNVERAFSDSYYPDNRDGYLPTLHFEAGLQHMDGERALQFARSRHGTNSEGSDFARSKRQEKILEAAKDKVLKLKIASNLSTVNRLLDNLADHFRTNLEPWEMRRLYDLTRDIKNDSIFNFTLDYTTTGLLCDMILPDNGAYVLDLCPGRTSADLKNLVTQEFSLGPVIKEEPRVEFQNSTKVSQLAQKAKYAVANVGIEAVTVNYPGNEALATTIVYDLTGSKKPLTLKYLESELPAQIVSIYPFLDKATSPKPDFIVVLGSDVADKYSQIELPPIPVPVFGSGRASSTAPALPGRSTSTPAASGD